MTNLVTFNGPTMHRTEPDKVLSSQLGKLDEVLLLGQTEDGRFVFSSSSSDLGYALWLIEAFKHHIIADAFSETEIEPEEGE